MAWLIYEGQVVASVDSRYSVKSRSFQSCQKKLIAVRGVLLIKHTAVIHNLGAPAAVDVVLLDKDFVVIKEMLLEKNRILLINRAAKYILLASPKTLANYPIGKGDSLRLTDD